MMASNRDLFEAEASIAAEYDTAIAAWLSASGAAGSIQRESSVDVYRHMWAAFTAWCVGNALRIDGLTASALADFIASRGGDDELSARYAWRFIRLVDRVTAQRARATGRPKNSAADDLLAERPDLRYANADARDPLPDYLSAGEAKRLVVYLSSARPRTRTVIGRWQDVRNCAAVGLMLGAGLTPGEVRGLVLRDVVTDGGRQPGIPWKLRVAGNGNSPARETPLAGWAGQLLAYWIGVRTEQAMPGNMVFPATRASGKPWGKVSQYKSAQDVLTAAGVDASEGGSFRLRHTFAIRQLRRGSSPLEVSKWLGVSDPAVMARYQRVVSAPVDIV